MSEEEWQAVLKRAEEESAREGRRDGHDEALRDIQEMRDELTRAGIVVEE